MYCPTVVLVVVLVVVKVVVALVPVVPGCSGCRAPGNPFQNMLFSVSGFAFQSEIIINFQLASASYSIAHLRLSSGVKDEQNLLTNLTKQHTTN